MTLGWKCKYSWISEYSDQIVPILLQRKICIEIISETKRNPVISPRTQKFAQPLLGVERNRKQRNPVNSIIPSIVSGTLLCTHSSGPFIAVTFSPVFSSSCMRKKISCENILHYLKYMCKEQGWNTGLTRIFCQHVIIENRKLK